MKESIMFLFIIVTIFNCPPIIWTAEAGPTTEIGRDGRFIAYDNGTVKDTKTGIMWAAKDNGDDINWQGAKDYCKNYQGGGYTDWRMPTRNELRTLYDPNKNIQFSHHATELIGISGYNVWTSDSRGSEACLFDFFNGRLYWDPQSESSWSRVLPMRIDN